MAQAFADIRVLDFTQVLAGPFAVMQLALLGAEVIKIEQPGSGDQTRSLMQKAVGSPEPAPSFLTCNVNKRSLTLNLKAPEATSLVHELVRRADVVVENFKAGTMHRLGLDYASLSRLQPALIYCSISGYGQKGPLAGAAAYDGAIQAASGMMSQVGHAETGPTRTGYMPVDMATALNAAFAITAALLRRERGGGGQYIDLAMLDTAVQLQAVQFANYLQEGGLVGLRGNGSPTGQPTADVFATADGFIQITALRQSQVEVLFGELGLAALLQDANFATPKARAAGREQVRRLMTNALAGETTAVWLARLAEAGVPVAPVRTLPEVMEEPQLAHRRVFADLPLPGGSGRHQVVTSGFLTDADGPSAARPAPLLGDDTDAVLAELGYGPEKIADLRKREVI